jgi:hypothetical protein
VLPFPVIINATLRSSAHSLPAPPAMRRPNPPCHPEQREGSAFLRSLLVPVSSSVLSVTSTLKITPSDQGPEQIRASACQPSCRTVLKEAHPLARIFPPTALASLLAPLCKKSANLSPFFSNSRALFEKGRSCNSFPINKFHTLSQNTGCVCARSLQDSVSAFHPLAGDFFRVRTYKNTRGEEDKC